MSELEEKKSRPKIDTKTWIHVYYFRNALFFAATFFALDVLFGIVLIYQHASKNYDAIGNVIVMLICMTGGIIGSLVGGLIVSHACFKRYVPNTLEEFEEKLLRFARES